MKRALFAMSLLLTAFGIAAFVGWGDSPIACCAEILGKAGAAPQPTGSAPSPGAKDAKPPTALKYESAIPKRELALDQSEEEVTFTYVLPPSATPREVASVVQEDRYAAFVALQVRVPNPGSFSAPESFYHPSERLQRSPDVFDSFFRRAPGPSRFPMVRVPTDEFNRLVSSVPAERLPSSDVLKMLISQVGVPRAEPLRAVVLPGAPAGFRERLGSRSASQRASAPPDFSELTATLALRAPTADRAKDLVRALLVIFDYGESLPKYENYVELKQHYESKLPDWQAATKEPEENYLKAQKALEKFAEAVAKERITREELASLAAQQRLIAVEEAGVKARIAASEKMMKMTRGPGGPPGYSTKYEALETLKTTAEIELVGLAAKRVAIQDIMDRERKRTELARQVNALGEKLGAAKSRVEEGKRRLAMYSTAVEEKMPFAEVEGKIFIRRIKWEERELPSGAVGRSGATSPSPSSRATRGKSK